MKRIKLVLIVLLTIVFSVVVIALNLLLAEPPSALLQGDSPNNSEFLAFIKTVLPLDISRYNITLKHCMTEEYQGYLKETGQYILEADESTLDIICIIENNVLWSCSMYLKNGSVIIDRPYSNINDAATSFLLKYQNHTGLDSTEMIDMLSNVDPTRNTTVTSGSLKLTVTHKDLSGTVFGDAINFRWVHTFNGCDYLAMDLVFRDGVFSGLIDHRQLYSIGDTAVNVSMKEAREIALKCVENHSYYMGSDIWISDFDVMGTSATLISQEARARSEPYVLYPCWVVKVFFDKTYPGSVDGLIVWIWADSGEVLSTSHFRYRWPPEY
jgi:hypothetical protein